MRESTERHYAGLADRFDGEHLRDVQASQERQQRARNASRFMVSDGMSPMTAGWAKYHPGERPVSVIDMDGKPRWITPKQFAVLRAVRTLQDQASMARIASSLGFATSTVSRALLRLSSLGLIAYDVARGRYGGIRIVKASVDELKRRGQASWERLKRYRMKAEARWYDKLVRSGYTYGFNVATIYEQGATLKAWSAFDMEEVDREYACRA